MNDLKLDTETWDLVVEDFDLATVDGLDAIEQNIGQRLKTFLGEYFLDTRIGIPYFQEIFKKKYDPIIVDTAFKRELINTNGVLELLEFSLTINNTIRQLNLSTRILTSSGVVNYELAI